MGTKPMTNSSWEAELAEDAGPEALVCGCPVCGCVEQAESMPPPRATPPMAAAVRSNCRRERMRL